MPIIIENIHKYVMYVRDGNLYIESQLLGKDEDKAYEKKLALANQITKDLK